MLWRRLYGKIKDDFYQLEEEHLRKEIHMIFANN